MTYTAKQLVSKAWNGKHTWSDDYTVKVGKISKDQAYEIVYQPSNKEFGTLYKLSTATLRKNGDVVGKYLGLYKDLESALEAVNELKN